MKHNSYGCSIILLVIAVMIAGGTVWNYILSREDLASVPRMKVVRAVVLDKGIAVYRTSGTARSSTTSRPWDRPATNASNTDVQKWIRFKCRIGDRTKDGSALCLFSHNESVAWPKFEKGKEYDAYWDPETDMCYLNIDQDPVGVAARLRLGLGFATVLAILASALLVWARRPSPM